MEGITVKNRLLASTIKLSFMEGAWPLLFNRFCISVNASNPEQRDQKNKIRTGGKGARLYYENY